MTLQLYMALLSPPSRAVLLTAKLLNLDLNLIQLDLSRGEHLKDDYLKINPLHTVPTLIDGDLIIKDSHAINIYLVETYAKNHHLYPENDPKQKALINEKLYYDSSILFPLFRNTVVSLLDRERYVLFKLKGPIFYRKSKEVSIEQIERIHQCCGVLDRFLDTNPWICGNEITLADLSLITTITSLGILVSIEVNKFPNLSNWIERFNQLSDANINKSGLDDLKRTIELCLK